MNAPDPPHIAWLAKAENDLLNVQNNLTSARIPWDTVCFHCQQAAEKLLKAFLAYQGQALRRTHDLVALLAEAAAFDPSLTGLHSDCQSLTYYAVAVRYADTLYEPDEADGRAMVAAAQRVRAAILPLPAGPGPTP